MDPLTAVSLAGTVLQIVDFSCKVLSKGNELRRSFTGVLPENAQLETITLHLRDLVIRLQKQSTGSATAATPGHGAGGSLPSLANMCMQTSEELLSVLEKLKVQGRASRWKSFRQAVKSVWKKEKIEEVLGRLQLIKQEIEFGFILDLKDDLLALSSEQSTRFGDLDDATRAVLQAVLDGRSASSAASDAQLRALHDMNDKLQSLVIDEHQQTRNEIIGEIRQHAAQFSISNPGYNQQYDPNATRPEIIPMLKFNAIDDRHSAIPGAHKQTFEWIWASDEQTGWSNYWNWLTHGRGIYWVSGKAGSGKSTLMKYMYHDERTSRGLEHWSGSRNECVMAGFFFWNSGSLMQKSLVGLLRSILHEVLKQKPDLENDVFPPDVQTEIHKTLMQNVQHEDYGTVWTIPILKAAFNRLLAVPSLKIFLLIDGLDEYEGDHQEISQLFMGIIQSPGVKACLSSRPLVVFDRAFSACPRLRLQDLTEQDIRRYVREKLEREKDVLEMSMTDPDEFEQLIQEIMDKASGVFLWISLVVKSLLEGITNFDRMADLRQRLKEIPDDLSQLYWHILRGIKPAFYFQQAAKLLRIVYVARAERVMTTDLLLASDEYEIGKGLRNVFIQSQKNRDHSMMVRLNSRCRGLLEVKSAMGGSYVRFLHLSVSEFLSQPEVATELDSKIPGDFNAYACLLAGILTQVKYQDEHADLISSEGRKNILLMFSLAKRLDQAHYPLLEELNQVIHERVNHFQEFKDAVWTWRSVGLPGAGIIPFANESRPIVFNDTFISLCAEMGLVEYIKYRLDQGESLHQGPDKRPLLDFLVTRRVIRMYEDSKTGHSELLKMLEALFERGADPNERVYDRTIWKHLLYHAEGDHAHWEESQTSKWKVVKPMHEAWIDVMQIFINHGANPAVEVANERTGARELGNPAAFLLYRFIPHCPTKRLALHKTLMSIYPKEFPYRTFAQPRTNPWTFFLMPPPKPEDIPHLYRHSGPSSRPKAHPSNATPHHEGLMVYEPPNSLSAIHQHIRTIAGRAPPNRPYVPPPAAPTTLRPHSHGVADPSATSTLQQPESSVPSYPESGPANYVKHSTPDHEGLIVYDPLESPEGTNTLYQPKSTLAGRIPSVHSQVISPGVAITPSPVPQIAQPQPISFVTYSTNPPQPSNPSLSPQPQIWPSPNSSQQPSPNPMLPSNPSFQSYLVPQPGQSPQPYVVSTNTPLQPYLIPANLPQSYPSAHINQYPNTHHNNFQPYVAGTGLVQSTISQSPYHSPPNSNHAAIPQPPPGANPGAGYYMPVTNNASTPIPVVNPVMYSAYSPEPAFNGTYNSRPPNANPQTVYMQPQKFPQPQVPPQYPSPQYASNIVPAQPYVSGMNLQKPVSLTKALLKRSQDSIQKRFS